MQTILQVVISLSCQEKYNDASFFINLLLVLVWGLLGWKRERERERDD